MEINHNANALIDYPNIRHYGLNLFNISSNGGITFQLINDCAYNHMFGLFSPVYHELQFHCDLGHKRDKLLFTYFHKLPAYLINPEENLEISPNGLYKLSTLFSS